MESSNMKNMVVLKNLPSNMVEEAIIIFKETQKVRQKVTSPNLQSKSRDYILKEAEMLVTDYVCGMTDSFAKDLYQELNGIV